MLFYFFTGFYFFRTAIWQIIMFFSTHAAAFALMRQKGCSWWRRKASQTQLQFILKPLLKCSNYTRKKMKRLKETIRVRTQICFLILEVMNAWKQAAIWGEEETWCEEDLSFSGGQLHAAVQSQRRTLIWKSRRDFNLRRMVWVERRRMFVYCRASGWRFKFKLKLTLGRLQTHPWNMSIWQTMQTADMYLSAQTKDKGKPQSLFYASKKLITNILHFSV